MEEAITCRARPPTGIARGVLQASRLFTAVFRLWSNSTTVRGPDWRELILQLLAAQPAARGTAAPVSSALMLGSRRGEIEPKTEAQRPCRGTTFRPWYQEVQIRLEEVIQKASHAFFTARYGLIFFNAF
jgi:hypothetical protein